MKEILLSYYNLVDIEVIDNKYYCCFSSNNKKYYFVKYTRDKNELSELVNLCNELKNRNIPTAIFITNKYGNLLTTYNEKDYVLLEYSIECLTEYNILDMLRFSQKLSVSKKSSILYRNNWADLWSAKIDYFEYQIAELGKEKNVILNSFSYYVGLAENAIQYVSNTLKEKSIVNEKITLQRKRVNFPNILLNYFNPLGYVIDIEVRDIASYFKSLFFNSYDDLYIEVDAYLKTRRLSTYGYQLLYSRLLYPSYYFDIYEKVIEGTCDEKELLKIVDKADDYEIFLKTMFFKISEYAPIERVDWIIKN